MQIIEALKNVPQEKRPGNPQEKFLPFDVRYALQYKDSMLNIFDVQSLVDDNLIHEALYMLMRGLDEHPEVQIHLLERYATRVVSKSGDVQDYKHLLTSVVDKIKSSHLNFSVNGLHLARMSRTGFNFLQLLYTNLAENCSQNNKTPVLVAYASVVGLHNFLTRLGENNQSIYLLKKNPKNDVFGFRVNYTQQNSSVEVLQTDFLCTNDNPMFIDDTYKTGKSMNLIVTAWYRNSVPENTSIGVLYKVTDI